MMNKKLKKATVAVAALSLAVSGVSTTIFPQNVAIVNASVDDEVFESGDFRYKVTDNNTKVSILGFTESAKEKTTVAIPTTVNYDDYDFPVAAIEEKAFKGNTAITSIVFTDKDNQQVYETGAMNKSYNCKSSIYNNRGSRHRYLWEWSFYRMYRVTESNFCRGNNYNPQ